VLHGCTQTAASYDHGTGWSRLADQHGFAVLYPEQQRANNPNLCFNWFVPDDIRRDSGEALSIAQMVRGMVESHALDGRRVFVTGLSAGGAMTSVLLATYPELFAGGAIVAGLPFGCAASIPEAFDRMRGHGLPSERELEEKVRRASSHTGPWPSISIWHGTADQTVSARNMTAVVAQWRGLHGLQHAVPVRNLIGAHTRQVWRDAAGIAKIEAISVAGMGHGTPLSGDDDIGNPGAFMLDAGISSTRGIAEFWQLTEVAIECPLPSRPVEPTFDIPQGRSGPRHSDRDPRAAGGTGGVGKIIEDALRAAGLMR
jgi:poly(hydroxyalkanoate) depolymerase family esterase